MKKNLTTEEIVALVAANCAAAAVKVTVDGTEYTVRHGLAVKFQQTRTAIRLGGGVRGAAMKSLQAARAELAAELGVTAQVAYRIASQLH